LVSWFWVGNQWFDVFATAGAGNTAKFDFWGKQSYNLKYPTDYFDANLAGTDYIVPQEKWIDVTLFMDDMGNTTGDFRFKVFVDGVCMMPETNLSFSTYGATYNNNSGMRYYWFQGDSTQVLLDDVEIRSEADRQAVDHPSYSTKILNTAPTAAITSGHEGTGVSVENKELNIEFSGATAEGVWPPEGCQGSGATPGNIGNGMGLTTNRVMDTTTYSNNITVKAGTNVLTEGVHYTLSWNDTKNLKINFVNNLYGNKEYTVSLNENIKNLLGYTLDENSREFSFVTEVVEGEVEPPVVGLSTTNNGKRFLPGEEITFEATALSANDIAKVEFYASEVNGKCELPAPYATATEAPYQATVSFAEEGTYEVYAKATDSEGLYDFSNKIKVVVDETAEINWDVFPSDNYVFFVKDFVDLEAKATSDAGENLSAVTLTVDGKSVSNPYKGGLEIGKHTMEATVLDSRGTSYTKTVNFEYRPEYGHEANGQHVFWNFNNDGEDFKVELNPRAGSSAARILWVDDCQPTYEQYDEEHGDSLTFTAGNGSQWKAFNENPNAGNYQNESIYYEYDILLEDVNAFIIRFPLINNIGTGLEVKNGKFWDNQTNEVFGYIENGKWYKVKALFDTQSGLAVCSIGDIQAIKTISQRYEGTARAYGDLLWMNAAAEAGKKVYIDNFTFPRAYVLPKTRVLEMKNVKADGSKYVSDYVTADTKAFELTFNAHSMGTTLTDKFQLFQGETQIPVTVEYPTPSKTGDAGNYYKGVIIKPADSNFKFEAGKIYTIKMLPGITSSAAFWAAYNNGSAKTARTTSVMTYEFTKTATASDIVYEKAAVYSDGEAIDNMNAVVGNKVKFGLTAQSFNSEADNEVLLIIAGYGENEELVSISAKTVTVGSSMDTYYTDEIDVTYCNSVKGFIWDDMAGLEPIGLGVGF